MASLTPLKKTQVSNGTVRVSCLVDGCNSDLTRCREYHRRHRVCERHSKTPTVMVGGEEKRFCQQCSKFHSLGEFDEAKRSCRKRLDGHNRRRRKSQPGTWYLSSKSFMSNLQGTRILQFGIPQVNDMSSRRSRKCFMTAESEAESMNYGRHQKFYVSDQRNHPNTFTWTFSDGTKCFPLIQANDPAIDNQAATEVPPSKPLQGNVVSSESQWSGRESDESTQSINSDCILYLLSTHQSEAYGIGINKFMQSTIFHPVSEVQLNSLGENDLLGSVLIPEVCQSNVEHDRVIPLRPDRMLEDGSLLSLPVVWQ